MVFMVNVDYLLRSGILLVVGFVVIVAGALLKFDPIIWLGILIFVAGLGARMFMR